MTRGALTLLLLTLAWTTAASAQGGELPPGAFPVLVQPGLRNRVVLRADTEAAWARGGLRLLHREWPTAVSRRARIGALPRDVRADARGNFYLSDGRRTVCTVRLGRPQLFRHVTPEFSYPGWNGEEGGPRADDATVARAAWDMAEGSELLVAPVVWSAGNCDGATWASRRRLDFGTSVATPEASLIEAFRALPEYEDLAEAWLGVRQEEDPDEDNWEERSGGTSRRILEFSSDGRRFSLVTADAYPGCGDFVGTLWALFESTADGWHLLHGEEGNRSPLALSDLDGDSVPEVLSFRHVFSVSMGAGVGVDAPFLGCNC